MHSARLSVVVLFSLLLAGFDRPQRNESARVLEPGTPIEDMLGSDQTTSLEITVDGGRYMQVVVEKNGLNIVVRLRGPKDDEDMQVESGPDDEGSLSISLISQDRGAYELAVQRRGTVGGEGRYRVSLSEPRSVRPDDEKRAAAEKAYAQGERLRADRSAKVFRERLARYETALPLWREIGDLRQEALALSRIGSVYSELSEHQKALEYLQQALSLSRTAGDRRTEAFSLRVMGIVYENRGELQESLKYSREALALFRDVKDRSGEAATLYTIGLDYVNSGENASALEYLDPALHLARAVEDRFREAAVLVMTGSTYANLGEPQKGLENLRQSLTIFRELHDRYAEAATLSNLGVVYDRMGRMQESIDCHMQALRLKRAIGMAHSEAYSLLNIGADYLNLGETRKALEYLTQSLPLWDKAEDRKGSAEALKFIGQAYAADGDAQKALEYYEQALRLHRLVPDHRGEALTLDVMGEAYLALGTPLEATNYYTQALSIHREVGYKAGEIYALTNLGSVYTTLNETQKAFDYLDQALHLARANGNQIHEAGVLVELSRAERNANHLQEALARANEAIDLTERARQGVIGSDVRASYLARVHRRYDLQIALLMQLHDQHPTDGFDAVALEASERARARALLDLLSESHVDIRQGVEPELLDQERSLQASLNGKAAYRIQLLTGQHTGEQVSDLEKQIAALTTRYEETETQIRARSPRYAALTQPQILTVADIQRQLDADTLLLEYTLGDERSFLWSVTPDALAAYELPNRTEIETASRRAYQALSVNSATPPTEATTVLSRMLLGPVARQLGSKRLLIVAEGALLYVPFAALRTAGGTPLIAEHEIVTLPSASTLAVLRRETAGRKRAPKLAAILADPVFNASDPRVGRASSSPGQADPTSTSPVDSTPASLPDELDRSARETGVLHLDRLVSSRKEADTIVGLAGNDASWEALDFDANRQAATNPRLGDYRIVHIASHTLLNSQHPHLSGLVLSLVDPQGRAQDGFLQMHDIYNLKLNADLVVLSACETALGRDVRGEGLIGLTRGFMYAGAPRVVASLWRVPDSATAELMKRFYEGLLRDGLRPAAALRRAQVALSNERRWSAPYYWAGFIIQGDW